MASDYERIVCVKNEVFVFKIPPRPSNRGYRAADWNLNAPDWTGRLRIVALGKKLTIRLEDKTSGELFAQCPVEAYPGIDVEAVMDSSRYFVLRIKDDSGRSAFIGIGFQDRADSFDLNVGLQDHFKWIRQEKELAEQSANFEAGPKLDLGFKEGQTIKINLNTKKSDSQSSKPRPRTGGSGGGGIGLLPPPPGGIKLPPPRAHTAVNAVQNAQNSSQPAAVPQQQSNMDLLFDLGAPPPHSSGQPQAPPAAPGDLFGGLAGIGASASSTATNSQTASADRDWIQF